MRIGYTTTTGGAISTPVEGGSRSTPPCGRRHRLVHLVHAVALASVSAWRQGFVREVGARFVWRADVCTHRTTPRPSGLEPMDWDVTDVSDHAPGFASPRLDSRSAVSSSGQWKHQSSATHERTEGMLWGCGLSRDTFMHE